MATRTSIGDVALTGSEIRAGVLNAETWPKIFEQNNKVWKNLGGCPLSEGQSGGDTCAGKLFNYFPTRRDAVLEWSDQLDTNTAHVAATKAKNATIDIASLPFLNHKELPNRPTLLAFEVTGHVMLGIIYKYNKVDPKGVVQTTTYIHILNPWNMNGSEQYLDVLVLLETKLGRKASNIIVVDVTADLEDRYETTINLQEDEKQGFCTLWVGIFANAVIPRLQELYAAVKDPTSTAIGQRQLNEKTLSIYAEVYHSLIEQREAIIAQSRQRFGEDYCSQPYSSAAAAAVNMATQAAVGKGGKRKHRRQTKRRPLFRRRRTMKRLLL